MNHQSNNRPTKTRHLVVFGLMLMSILLYLDRFCVGMAEPYIKQDLGLSTFQVGIFFSAFFLTYALGQVPSGWLSDRFGARLMLTVYILTWSLFTALMGVSYGFVMLLLMRAAYGLGQAGAYPTSANVLSKWVPFSNRGTASSLVAFGGRLGGAIAPVLTALMIVLFVPTGSSSLLTPKSLRDGAALCVRLSQGESSDLPAALQRVRASLPLEVQRTVDSIANEYRPFGVRKKNLEQQVKQLQRQWRLIAASRISRQAQQIVLELSEKDRNRIVDALNQIVQSDEFYRQSDFDEMKNLDRVALRFLARVNRGQKLSNIESERFHRLLLEGCFPDEIIKVYVSGWRPVMIIYGVSGILVAGFFFFIVRNRPEDYHRCNQAELDVINAGRPRGAPSPYGKVGNIPWSRLIFSRSMWLNCFGQVGVNIGWVFLVTWFPRYLLENHQVPILQRGLMAGVPLFAGWLGMLNGGWLTDYLVKQCGLRWGRILPWSFSRFVGMAAFFTCPLLDDPWAVTITLSVVAISTDLGTASGWAYCQDVGGKYTGSILGWGNMWGNLGATVSPILLAWIFESWGWTEMFMVCAASYLVAGCLILGIDATVPIAPIEDE